MLDGFHQLVDGLVRAAIAEDRAFGDLLPRVMNESGSASRTDLDAALPRLARGIAEAPPNLGGWLAVVAGAWVEKGADPDVVGMAVVERATEVAAASFAFADAWKEATGGGPPPDPEQGAPSQQIVDTIAPHDESPVLAMMSWFSMERFALGANTMLSRSPRLRAAVPDRDFRVFAFSRLEEHCPKMGWVAGLLRVLEDERLLVLDRRSRGGWTVAISGIGDNFQLHTLLGGALVGRPGGLPGHAPDPRWIDCFTAGDVQPGTPAVTGWWNLVDAHGEWIWNEGVPADIPAVNGTRVVVLDPPAYERSWSPGRRFPMMPGSLTVEGMHTPEDLASWWPHIAAPKQPYG